MIEKLAQLKIRGSTKTAFSQKQIAQIVGARQSEVKRLNAKKKFSPSSIPLYKNAELVTAVKEILVRRGLKNLTIRDVHADLQLSGLARIPSMSTTYTLLTRQCGMNYRHFNSANLRYQSAKFDEKR